MDTKTIVICVVALLLGMLIANMLKDVCGCKNVEGTGNENKDAHKCSNWDDCNKGAKSWLDSIEIGGTRQNCDENCTTAAEVEGHPQTIDLPGGSSPCQDTIFSNTSRPDLNWCSARGATKRWINTLMPLSVPQEVSKSGYVDDVWAQFSNNCCTPSMTARHFIKLKKSAPKIWESCGRDLNAPSPARSDDCALVDLDNGGFLPMPPSDTK